MNTLLVLDSSPRRDAVSRSLTGRFVAKWQARFPDARIIHHDIGGNQILPILLGEPLPLGRLKSLIAVVILQSRI